MRNIITLIIVCTCILSIKCTPLSFSLRSQILKLGIIEDEEDSSKCVAQGRFRHTDLKCQQYYLCIKSKSSDDFIKSLHYYCPLFTIFNPTTSKCSFYATCIEALCDDQELGAKLQDPNSVDCKTYIQCEGTKEKRYPVLKSCGLGFFNQNLSTGPTCWLYGSC